MEITGADSSCCVLGRTRGDKCAIRGRRRKTGKYDCKTMLCESVLLQKGMCCHSALSNTLCHFSHSAVNRFSTRCSKDLQSDYVTHFFRN